MKSRISYTLPQRTNGRDADTYRLLQGAALLKLFKQDRGRAAETIEELNEWTMVQPPGPIDPFAVLDRDERVCDGRGQAQRFRSLNDVTGLDAWSASRFLTPSGTTKRPKRGDGARGIDVSRVREGS